MRMLLFARSQKRGSREKLCPPSVPQIALPPALLYRSEQETTGLSLPSTQTIAFPGELNAMIVFEITGSLSQQVIPPASAGLFVFAFAAIVHWLILTVWAGIPH